MKNEFRLTKEEIKARREKKEKEIRNVPYDENTRFMEIERNISDNIYKFYRETILDFMGSEFTEFLDEFEQFIINKYIYEHGLIDHFIIH